MEPDGDRRQATTAGPVGLGVAEGVMDGWTMTVGWAVGAAAVTDGELIDALVLGVTEGDGVDVRGAVAVGADWAARAIAGGFGTGWRVLRAATSCIRAMPIWFPEN